jgi:hypothetical protein
LHWTFWSHLHRKQGGQVITWHDALGNLHAAQSQHLRGMEQRLIDSHEAEISHIRKQVVIVVVQSASLYRNHQTRWSKYDETLWYRHASHDIDSSVCDVHLIPPRLPDRQPRSPCTALRYDIAVAWVIANHGVIM